MTEAQRTAAYRRLFELCLWPIEHGAEYDPNELRRTLTPIEMEVLAEELNEYAESLYEFPTELDV